MIIPIAPEVQHLEKTDIRELYNLQGNLKNLHSEAYFKLRNSLETFGFFVPFYVWKNPKDELFYYADGHQRDKVIKGEKAKAAYLSPELWDKYKKLETSEERTHFLSIVTESYLSYDFPVIQISAKNKNKAKEKLLVISSQYGKVEKGEFRKFAEDLDLSFMYDTVNLSEIRLEMLEPAPEPEIKEPKPEVTAYTTEGDLYEITSGKLKHRVHCGNAIEAASVETLMAGDLADMVFIDPPYNIKIKNLGAKPNRNNDKSAKEKSISDHEEFSMASGEMKKDEFINFLCDSFQNLISNSKNGSIHYVCMDWRQLDAVSMAGKLYRELKNICVWKKDNAGMGSFYRSKHEFIFTFKNGDSDLRFLEALKISVTNWAKELFGKLKLSHIFGKDKPVFYFDVHTLVFCFKNGKASNINNFELGQHGRSRSNVWEYPIVNSFANKDSDNQIRLHPTVKPLELVKDCLLDCSHQESIILDTFAGSGTTLLAAEETKRQARILEISPKFCDVILFRYITLMTSQKKEFSILHNGEPMTADNLKELSSKFEI